jgi:predicted N-acetyltransferase YhbS
LIEIRPIQYAEAETFLQLLCDVFDIEFQRAKSVFFAEPSFDLNRKWALFESGKMVSILTTTPIQIGAQPAVGIAGVATVASEQRRGLAQKLIERVMECSREKGEQNIYLFARDATVYSRCGFETIDSVVQGTINPDPEINEVETMPAMKVRATYDRWAKEGSDRFVRTRVRWDVWNWACRICEPAHDGYICYEMTTVREAILPLGLSTWPVSPGTDWLGLAHTTSVLEVPVASIPTGLFLMATPGAPLPVMFMTDQF